MATFLFQAQYSAAAFKGMVTQPSDRVAAATVLLASMGVKLFSFYYVPGTSGTSGIAGTIDGTIEQAATAGMVLCASGGFTAFESTEVLSGEQMSRVMKSASELASKYQAPN